MAFFPQVRAFRFYDDDGTESTSSPLQAENVNHTLDLAGGDAIVHLRYSIDETGGTAGSVLDKYQIEYSRNGGAWGTLPGTAGTNPVYADGTSQLTDNGATTNRATNGISDGGGSFDAGVQKDTSSKISHQLDASGFTEHVFAINFQASQNSGSDTYDFRVSLNGGSPGIANNVTPRITVSGVPKTVSPTGGAVSLSGAVPAVVLNLGALRNPSRAGLTLSGGRPTLSIFKPRKPKTNDVITAIITLFDETVSTTIDGPPIPFGGDAFGAEDTITTIGGESQIYLSDVGFNSRPADDPSNAVFAPRLSNPFNYEIRVFQGLEPTGDTRPGFGNIVANNGDGGLDTEIGYGWDGRPVRIYFGNKASAFTDHSLVFDGTCDGIEWDADKINIRLRDGQAVFDDPLQLNLYSGSGGKEGTSDLAGKPKPLCFGNALNVPAVSVDPLNLTYQIHDGQISAVNAVRDRGVSLSVSSSIGSGGDFTTYASLVNTSPATASYSTCKAEGFIRLGSAPDGQVTADVDGDSQGGFVNTTGTIVRRLITKRMGVHNFADPDDLDGGAFSDMEVDQPSAIGFAVFNAIPTPRTILNSLMQAIGGYWFTNRLGKFSLGVLKAPSSNVADTFTTGDFALRGAFRRLNGIPSYRRRLGYQFNWSVQSESELAGSVSQSARQFYREQQRFSQATNVLTRSKHKLAPEVQTNGFFASSTSADTEVARQLALFSTDRDIYELTVDRDMFDFDIGQSVKIEGVTRFGLTDPSYFRIVGMIASGRKLTLILWG